MYEWLDAALDWGISECEFWDMTLAEIQRLLASKRRALLVQQKEKATFDYILADLIGRSVSRIYSSSSRMPEINKAYPSLFNSDEVEEAIQKKKDEISAIRFKQFAENFNKKFKQPKEQEVDRVDERKD